MQNRVNVLTELKRKRVYPVAVIYGAAAWGLLQAADIIFPRTGLPDWSVIFYSRWKSQVSHWR